MVKHYDFASCGSIDPPREDTRLPPAQHQPVRPALRLMTVEEAMAIERKMRRPRLGPWCAYLPSSD